MNQGEFVRHPFIIAGEPAAVIASMGYFTT